MRFPAKGFLAPAQDTYTTHLLPASWRALSLSFCVPRALVGIYERQIDVSLLRSRSGQREIASSLWIQLELILLLNRVCVWNLRGWLSGGGFKDFSVFLEGLVMSLGSSGGECENRVFSLGGGEGAVRILGICSR